jgi:hypothetical protein
VQHISAAKMIAEHWADQCIAVDPTCPLKVFCKACKKSYPLIKSSVDNHCFNTTTHPAAVTVYFEKHGDDTQVKGFIEDYFQHHPEETGASTSLDLHLVRWRATETFLANGVPLAKVNGMRTFFERSGLSLTDSKHLAALYIPKILKREHELLSKEIFEQYICIVFDGTTRLGEAVNVIFRYCPPDFSGIQQRLVDFTTLEKHMNGDELGQHLNSVISTKYGLPPKFIVGSARDSCSTNGAGLRVIAPLFTSMLGGVCYSHMLHCAGPHFGWVSLNEFVTPFLTLLGTPVVKSVWKDLVGTGLPGYSTTRWWSRNELMLAIGKAFGPVLESFVDELDVRDIGKETTTKMQGVLTNATKRDAFELELAMVVDMEPLVKTTYDLEGDRLEILVVSDRIERLRTMGRSLDDQATLPNTAAVLRARVDLKDGKKADGVKFRWHWYGADVSDANDIGWWEGNVLKKAAGRGGLCVIKFTKGPKNDSTVGGEMIIKTGEEASFRGNIIAHTLPEWAGAVAKIKPAFDYIESRLTDNCDQPYHMKLQHEQMYLLKAFDPSFAKNNVDDPFVDNFKKIPPFVGHRLIPALKAEREAYVAAAQNFGPSDHDDIKEFTKDVLAFWAMHGKKFPTWAIAARITFALTPNSAACERVFSLLKLFFGPQQDASLADQIEAALSLNYNKRPVG